MSSEAAQKAYPADEWSAGEGWRVREAFDRGAVEALRQAADTADRNAGYISVEQLTNMADEWERGSA